MTKVTFTAGFYRNTEFTGTVTLVQDFTAWGGALEGEGKRRVGTAGAGYVKVVHPETGKAVKVTVVGNGVGYTINADETEALRAEVAELEALIPTLTGAERAAARKRLARRVAKLG